MTMNREQRRYLQKQGQLDKEGNPIAKPRERGPVKADRVGPRTYLSEVNSELRRVTWPTTQETIKYTIVVLVTLLLFTGLIAGLDFLFGEGIIKLLELGQNGE